MQAQWVASLYDQAGKDAAERVGEVQGDQQLTEALREGDCQAARERLQALVDGERIEGIRLVDENGEEVCVDASRAAIAPATLRVSSGESLGRLQVSVTSAAGSTRRVRQDVRRGLAVCMDNRLLATSVEGVGNCRY